MKIIVCLDDKNGMLFNKRRQSSDRVLRDRILSLVNGGCLRMNAYSAKQFAENASISVDEQFLEKAQRDDFCFVENVDVFPFADKVESVIVYRWNTVYPSDVQFPACLLDGKTLMSAVDFTGYSHTRITEEIYE